MRAGLLVTAGATLVAALLVACPLPPAPVNPPLDPSDAASAPAGCGLAVADHDRAENAVVAALESGGDPQAQSTEPRATARCLVQEAAANARNAPQLSSAAAAWLQTHP